MSALLDSVPRYRRMTSHDLDQVMAIEHVVYPHPWTRGNFSDSLREGYHCWVVEVAAEVIAYGVIYNLILSVVGVAIVLLAMFGWAIEPSVADDSDYDPPAGGDTSKELATLG